MPTQETMEEQRMPKAQKSVLLPEDLLKAVAAEEFDTGVSFARIVTAALLQRYCEHVNCPDSLWIKWATLLDKENLQVADIPIAEAKRKIQTWQGVIKRQPERDNAQETAFLKEAKKELREWRNKLTGQDGQLDSALLATNSIRRNLVRRPDEGSERDDT
ncbi:MAG TPA: hypothetical protein VM487_10530 [Phycisphaerae bacterium]|nr:hypothetical protein [Phycisphaerae bacterium]